VDDSRYRDLNKKVEGIAGDVKEIRDMLISEPEKSPLGRALLKIANDNRKMILDNEQDFEEFRDQKFTPIYDWWNQTKGSWRVIQGAAVILAIVGAFFGILSWFGIRGQ
jgi:hypothetical protein